MRALSPIELLSVWERGEASPPTQRALLLLAAAHPDVDPDRLAHLSVGRRDARLIALRRRLFGAGLLGVSTCPECGERVEVAFDPAAIGIASDSDPDPGALAPVVATLSVAGHQVAFRPPDGEDLAAVAGAPDLPTARAALLARCILFLRRDGADVAPDDAPPEVMEAVVERMAALDPDADVQLALTCPDCGHAWPVSLDIVSFLWREIDAWAARALREVHVLASAYGWRESDILRLSPARRRAYLELIAE